MKTRKMGKVGGRIAHSINSVFQEEKTGCYLKIGAAGSNGGLLPANGRSLMGRNGHAATRTATRKWPKTFEIMRGSIRRRKKPSHFRPGRGCRSGRPAC